MKPSTIPLILRHAIRLAAMAILPATALAQGPLTPPAGAPTASMKSLDQIEPRKAVQSLALAPPYTINAPGSYYLTGNITVASGNAIVITADGVSLDLNGFCIESTSSGVAVGSAVLISGVLSRITIRNGSITSGTTYSGSAAVTAGFNDGVYSSSPVLGVIVSDLHIAGTGASGIRLVGRSIVERCVISGVGGIGIAAEEIRNCNAYSYVGVAIYATGNAVDCTGFSENNVGLNAGNNAMNCSGGSTSSTGMVVGRNATNCSGTSSSGAGLSAVNATTCFGKTSGSGASAIGLQCTGTASSCRGESPGAGLSLGLKAAIAIGCTFSGATSIPVGKSFNM